MKRIFTVLAALVLTIFGLSRREDSGQETIKQTI